MTHLSLFSGIGGLDLAAEMAGFTTVGQCEWADYPTKVLEKYWPDVPRWRDIRTLTGDSFYEKTGLRTVDVLSGGFPCQPFSVAGKHGGKDDDRYLWPEMLRVIRELKPTWVLGENVPGIIDLALDTVLADLEDEGYETQAFVIPACGVDAPHKRYRVAILAHTIDGSGTMRRDREFQNASGNAEAGPDNGRRTQEPVIEKRTDESGPAGMVDGIRTGVDRSGSDTDRIGLEGRLLDKVLGSFTDCSCREREKGLRRTAPQFRGSHSPWEDWPDEPGIDRVVDGIPNRVDRIKCLGNAVVPQQFYPIFKAIMEVEQQ